MEIQETLLFLLLTSCQTLPGNCPVTHNQISLDISIRTGYEMNSQSSLPVCLR